MTASLTQLIRQRQRAADRTVYRNVGHGEWLFLQDFQPLPATVIESRYCRVFNEASSTRSLGRWCTQTQ
jgi:hypothetical protein